MKYLFCNVIFWSKEGQLSHEEAKIAKQHHIKMTQQNAQLLKEEVSQGVFSFFNNTTIICIV